MKQRYDFFKHIGSFLPFSFICGICGNLEQTQSSDKNLFNFGGDPTNFARGKQQNLQQDPRLRDAAKELQYNFSLQKTQTMQQERPSSTKSNDPIGSKSPIIGGRKSIERILSNESLGNTSPKL